MVAPSITEEVDLFKNSPVQRAEGDWVNRIGSAASLAAPTRELYQNHFRAEIMAEEFLKAYRAAV